MSLVGCSRIRKAIEMNLKRCGQSFQRRLFQFVQWTRRRVEEDNGLDDNGQRIDPGAYAMNSQNLKECIALYKKMYDSAPDQFIKDMDERDERSRHYRQFDAQHIRSFSSDELIEYLGKLWAMRMWGNKHYKITRVIEDTGFERLKEEIANLLYGDSSVETRWDRFVENVKGLGYAAASELLSYIEPDQYVVFNGTTNKAFKYLEIPLATRYTYQRTGSHYVKVCNAAKVILGELKNGGLPSNDLLAVDYFFWDILQEVETTKPGTTAKEDNDIAAPQATSIPSASLHNELRDRLVDIGTLLGFEARPEVSVGTGAKVDAVWEAQIGNMGKVMYVFEVQDKGSIDSLILNLVKANNNPAVQAIVAVSDVKQLEKIKAESMGTNIQESLKAWDAQFVLETYEHLSAAHEAINSLGLVPESF